MKHQSQKSEFKKLQGVAKLLVNPQNPSQYGVQFRNAETRKFDGEKVYPLDEVPENVLTLNDDERKQNWFIRISGDGKKIWNIRPADGVYEMDFTGFFALEGQVPTVYEDTKIGFNGESYVDRSFTPEYEIVGPKCKGFTVPLYLKAKFRNYDGVLGTYGKTDNVKTQDLLNWVKCHGLDGVEIPYVDNPLPSMMKIILRGNQKRIHARLEDGYVQNFFAANAPASETGEFVPEVTDPGWNEPVTETAPWDEPVTETATPALDWDN